MVDPEAAALLIASALKPGGVLLITTGNLSKHKGPIANWYYGKSNPDVHITFFTPIALSVLLARHGLTKIDIKFDNQIILYKVLKNIFALPLISESTFLKESILKYCVVFVPLLLFIDNHFGVSEQGLYKKSI